MRVIHVIPYLNRRRGGDVSVCCSISKRLVAKGHQAVILTSDFELEQDLVKELRLTGVKVEVFHCVSSFALFLATPSMKKWLAKNVAEYDLVHIHDFRSYQSIVASRQSKKAKVHYLLHPHGSIRKAGGKWYAKSLFDIVWGRGILRHVSRIVAVSKEEAHDLRQMGVSERKIAVIYNGIDSDECSRPESRIDFKKLHSVGGRMLLYVGRLHESKGIDFALRAFAAITKEFEDTTMVICGSDDGYRKELENLASELKLLDRVKFLDFIEDDEKMSAYAQAHVFVHTVKYMGGVGLAPLEAILCGAPVVVTRECSEIVEMADAGYIVEFDNVEALATTFGEILTNQGYARERASQGGDLIRREFSWDAVMDRIVREYVSALTGSD